MPEMYAIGWVKTAFESTGRDHLGLQSQSVHVYSQLFDAITNITPRARYFTFYCWLTKWLAENHPNDFRDFLRRADVLFGLITLSHGQTMDDSENHDTGVLGYNTLSEAIKEICDGKTELMRLSDLTGEKPDGKRYLKAKFGGYGQNYLGPLQDNGMITRRGPDSFDLERGGLAFALAFEQTGLTEKFGQLVERDSVNVSDLEELHPLCMCQLSANPAETNLLARFLFQEEGYLAPGTPPRRREGFRWIHWLLGEGMNPDMKSFRGYAYSGCSPDGAILDHPNPSDLIRSTWSDYVLNELYAVALQGMLWTMLSGGSPQAGTTLEQWVALIISESCDQLDVFHLNDSSSCWLQIVEKNLPEVGNWSDTESEVYLAEQIVQQVRQNEEPINVLISSLKLYLSLCCRLKDRENPVFESVDQPEFFHSYPANLYNLHQQCRNQDSDWWKLSGKEWLHQLLLEDVLQVHMQVALRKLNEGKHTFCFVPDERGIHVRQIPQPVFTMPRFRNAIRMLADLGFIENNGKQLTVQPLPEELSYG